MATAQPISLPPQSSDNDLVMASGSFTGQNGSFNPASYTRRFVGSPASLRAGSFGSRFYPGMSPGQLLGPLESVPQLHYDATMPTSNLFPYPSPNDFRFAKLSSSIESDRGSIMNALNVFDRQDELCRDYQCCGVNLTDMHALVDHFEECHVVVFDPHAPQQSYRNFPAVAPPNQPGYFPDPQNPVVGQTYHQGSFDPDDMELDATEGVSGPSSGSSSPPDTPINTPLSSYPSPNPQALAQQAPSRPPPISAFDTTTVLPSRSTHSLTVGFPPVRAANSMVQPRAEDAFNAYAGYSDFSSLLPGTVPSSAGPSASDDSTAYPGGQYGARSGCVPPALLLNSTTGSTSHSTPSSSRVASPTPGTSKFPTNIAAAASSSAPASPTQAQGSQTPRASTTLSRPATSLLLSKPFKCPKPNCNKSYKQANGLKYHMTHGSCNFAPPKDLEQLQALLASKRNGEEGGEPITDAELREVEKEAERRLRPYACGVGDCQRRYKNMNGLRYHYQHSGDHGAIGLALLASGQHECLQHTRAHSRNATPAASKPPSANSSPRATPVVSQAQPTHQPATNFSSSIAAPPSYQSQSMIPPTYTLQPQHLTGLPMQQNGSQGLQYMMSNVAR